MATEGFSYVRRWLQDFESTGWWHSFDLPDGTSIQGTNSIDSMKERIGVFPIPEDLRGARVLDIGAWDGWFTFEMERRGAEVVAIDCWDNPKFRQMHAAMRSRAEYKVMDVFELTPAALGRFDIVLFMGVLYHLKHPLLALERVCALTKNLAAVDSFILQEGLRPGERIPDRPMMEFYENEEFGGQADNWCGPNLPCLLALCRTAGFARVEHLKTFQRGASVACYRKWATPEATTGTAPELLEVWHHLNFGTNFQSRRDEYVSIQFRSDGNCTIDNLLPEVGGYGVRPVRVGRDDEGSWRASFKLPPGLTPGWHDVTLRVADSPVSNAKPLAVDFPEPGPPRIEGASDGATWKPNELDLSRGNVLSVWLSGLPENADAVTVLARLGGERLKAIWIEPVTTSSTRQVNLFVPNEVPTGPLELEVNRSAPVVIRIVGR